VTRATLQTVILAVMTVVVVAYVLIHRPTPSARPTPAAQRDGDHGRAANPQAAMLDEGTPRSPSTTSIATPAIDAPSREAIARDPEAAARRWYAKAQRVVDAKWRQDLGDDVGALMSRPWDQAMPELRTRANDGDEAALAAIAHLQAICTGDAMRAKGRESHHSDAATRWKHLSPAWATFADRLRATHDDNYAERVAHCPDTSSTMDFAMGLIDKYLRPDNVDAQVGIAADNEDDTQAIADLRSLVAKGAGARAQNALADRLLTSGDAASQAEGLAMLERLAPDDPTIALRLAYCMTSGCDHFAARPADALPWIEEGAGSGEDSGLMMMQSRLDADGDASGAWAWTLYRLDLAIAGCFETLAPLDTYVGAAADDEAHRRASLSPAQQNAGLARYYEISGKWEKKARERLSCAQ
jgi:hypothetical protein